MVIELTELFPSGLARSAVVVSSSVDMVATGASKFSSWSLSDPTFVLLVPTPSASLSTLDVRSEIVAWF